MSKVKRKRSPKKIIRSILITIVSVYLALSLIGATLLFEFTFNRKSFLGVENLITIYAGTQGTSAEDFIAHEYSGFISSESDTEWFEKNDSDVYITSDDGLKLHGNFIENKKSNGKYMIVFHGFCGAGSHMRGYVKHFYDMGFSVLAPDARAHGTSEGAVRGMGWLERKDALLWINSIIQKDPDCKIGLFGVSMGGATVMMTAGEESLPPQVVVGIEDCGYTSVQDEIEYELTHTFHLLPFPLMNIASFFTKVFGGYGFKEASSLEQVKKSRIPLLFIHGTSDGFVPSSMLDEVFSAADCKKEKLLIEGAGHASSSSTNPELYWKTITDFIKPEFN